MGEHAGRYDWVAERLCDAGFEVFANDHRGHGRTATSPAELGDMGANGWHRAVQDLREIIDWIAGAYPGVARVLLGHSMGSLLARQYLIDHGQTLDAAILSGSTDGGGFQLHLTRLLARVERFRLGPRGESEIVQKALFGKSNRAFEPGRTGFEWLSRDPDQVDRYVEDPLCGFVLRMGSLCDMFDGLAKERRRSERRKIPGELPIYIFSGDRDPIHRDLAGLRRLLNEYRAAGLQQVQHRFYEGGRHEMFNETNREEVCRDLIGWLAKSIPSSQPQESAR
ncbi:MAG: alpha/beta fold hydrolase [Myxococcales bacterium]|nr:alpha/beta fold hydrolase [Myxococcales bacterium]